MTRRLIMAGLLALLCACSPDDTPEEQIAAAIGEMEERAESGDRRGFMQMVHREFQGQGGGMTRDEFRRFMIFQMSQHRRLRAQLFPIEVRMPNAEEGVAEFNALITGGSGWLPEEGRLFRIETVWRDEGGDWLLVRIALERLRQE